MMLSWGIDPKCLLSGQLFFGFVSHGLCPDQLFLSEANPLDLGSCFLMGLKQIPQSPPRVSIPSSQPSKKAYLSIAFDVVHHDKLQQQDAYDAIHIFRKWVVNTIPIPDYNRALPL